MSTAVVTVTGNLTTDPELSFTKNGVARLPFSIASTKKWQSDGQWQEGETSFFNAVAWRGVAETAAPILEKGLAVIVTGVLEQRSWTDDDGNKRSTVELNVRSVGPNCIGIESVTRKQRGEGTSTSRAPKQEAPVYDMDEEPF